MVYDTGSDWLVIEGQSCYNCQGDKYDISQALENGQAKLDSINGSERVYGSAKVSGKVYTDTVCVGLANCVEDFKIFLVES